MKHVLVVGATGATGRLLLQQLLDRGLAVRAVVRSREKLDRSLRQNPRLSVIEASILDLDATQLRRHVAGCQAIACCLGHNLTLRGLFGPPWRLVTEATRRLCEAVEIAPSNDPVRFVLMNTAGNRNRDLEEPRSLGEKAVIALLRLLLPPHVDNECAAEYLRTTIGQRHQQIEWAAVRPDSLIDEVAVSPYKLHPSPTRSALFNAGKTSRINVAHFMADLITDDRLWEAWKGQMPVIYNLEA